MLIHNTEIGKLPHIKNVPRDGRAVPLMQFFDDKASEWHLYVMHDEEHLVRLLDGEPIIGDYLSHSPANGLTDLEFGLGTMIVQHLSFEEVLSTLSKLEDDLRNCGAVLRTYNLIWTTRGNQLDLAATQLVQAQFEYVVLLLRSYYDLLQMLVRDVWSRLKSRDPAAPHPRKLPNSFRKMVLGEGGLIASAEIGAIWGIPAPLADWYATEAPFFRKLRDIRDGIAHHGHQPPSVFTIDGWGFAIDTSREPWVGKVHVRENSLGSFRAVFGGFIMHALQAATRLAMTIEQIIELPPALNEDLFVFVRSPVGAELTRLEGVLTQPWEGRDSDL